MAVEPLRKPSIFPFYSFSKIMPFFQFIQYCTILGSSTVLGLISVIKLLKILTFCVEEQESSKTAFKCFYSLCQKSKFFTIH